MGRTREKISGGGKALGGKRGKGSQQGKGAKDLREEKGEDLGGENALGGKGKGKDLNNERGEKILGRKRGKIAGEKGLREERRERISTGRGGKTS